MRRSRLRLAAARALIRLGERLEHAGALIEDLPVLVLRPDDLVAYGLEAYGEADALDDWGGDERAGRGLSASEADLASRLPSHLGRVLVLACGGGREAIGLAQMGYEVTAVDFVPELVERAVANAARRGLHLQGRVEDIRDLQVAGEAFDVVWLTTEMYSCIPTRVARVAALRRIHSALCPGGHFVCAFKFGTGPPLSRRTERVGRRLARLVRGNLAYEPGDRLWPDVGFLHVFTSEDGLRSEFVDSGFEVLHLGIAPDGARGAAVLRRAQSLGTAGDAPSEGGTGPDGRSSDAP